MHLNIAYRWFCRLGLDGKVPEHSTVSKSRHSCFRESDILRQQFECIVERYMAEGLVGAEGFAVDASLIAANVNKRRSVPTRDCDPTEIKDGAFRTARTMLERAEERFDRRRRHALSPRQQERLRRGRRRRTATFFNEIDAKQPRWLGRFQRPG